MKFRIADIAYFFALLAAAIAAFGPWGIAVAAAFQWMYVGPIPRSLEARVGILSIVALLLFILLPSIDAAREAARHSSCRGRLGQIALGLRNYQELNGALPPAVLRDPSGQPLHSWRTVLYAMNPQPLGSLINLNARWDSAANLTAAGRQAELHQCPSHREPTAVTHYFAVVGEHTAFPSTGPRKTDEITDPPETTLLLLEARHKQAAWSAPVDFTFDEAVEYLSTPPDSGHGVHGIKSSYFHQPSWQINALFADGQVRSLRLPLPRDVARAILTVDGGEYVDQSQFDRLAAPQLDYKTCYAFAAFLILAAWPAARLMLPRNRTLSS